MYVYTTFESNEEVKSAAAWFGGSRIAYKKEVEGFINDSTLT
jgi:hypothetical protein